MKLKPIPDIELELLYDQLKRAGKASRAAVYTTIMWVLLFFSAAADIMHYYDGKSEHMLGSTTLFFALIVTIIQMQLRIKNEMRAVVAELEKVKASIGDRR